MAYAHDGPLATKCTGDWTVTPLDGDETVTLPKLATAINIMKSVTSFLRHASVTRASNSPSNVFTRLAP